MINIWGYFLHFRLLPEARFTEVGFQGQKVRKYLTLSRNVIIILLYKGVDAIFTATSN